MLVFHATRVAVAAVAATLSVSSVRNMLQTCQVVASTASSRAEFSSSGGLAPGHSAAETVQLLQSYNRKELLQVYLHHTVDVGANQVNETTAIDGDWDGILLDNNGFLMTRVSQFLTHSLFGRGHRWNGKAFGVDSSLGKNRFMCYNAKEATKTPHNVRYDHSFDVGLESSRIDANLISLVLRYDRHQTFGTGGWTSLLWKSMVDEIRMVECENGECVLLGLGSMAWSGGMWNASPFCLFRPANKGLESETS